MDKSSEGVVIESAVGAVNCDENQCTTGESVADEWLIVSKRDAKSRLLPRRMIFVGRQDCDICVPSTTVDMRHAVLFFNGQYFHVKDLNSAYGTYVNDKRIAGQCYVRLEHSDRLRFGFGPDLFIIEKISSLPEKTSLNGDPKLISNEANFFKTCKQSVDNIDNPTKNNSQYKNNKPMQRLITAGDNSRSNSSLSNDSLDEIKSGKLNNTKVSDKRQLSEMNEKVNGSDQTTAPNACSSPTNAGPDSLGSVGSATAFTITFDDEEDDNKKKLNIKDSIRQFAPPKPDSIEKPRLTKSAKSETKCKENSFSNPKSPTNQTKRQNSLNGEKLMLTNKFKDSLSSSSAKSSPEPSGNLSDSATYLINRMLSNRIVNKLTQSPTNSRPASAKEHRVEKADSGLCDDIKSDSGNTYTVDENNAELEDARKKIDEVFGVNDNDSATLSLNSSPDSSLTQCGLNSPTLLKNIEQENRSKANQFSPKFERKSVPTIDSDTKQLTFTRTKRRAPTAAEMLHIIQPKIEEKPNVCPPIVGSNDLNRSYKSSHLNGLSNKTENQLKSSSTQSAPTTPRSPLIARKLMEMRLSKQTPNSSQLNRRKNSWTSDLDYNESYNSDDSTDQSHRSSNSALSNKEAKSGSDATVPSKINFNRAFALRRARLGIETPGIDTKPKLNPNLNRNDGGRFSLRAPKRDTQSLSDSGRKVFNNRISVRVNATKNSNLQRKGSDPYSGPKPISRTPQPVAVTERRNSLNNDRVNQLSNRPNSRNSLNCNNRSDSCKYDNCRQMDVSTPKRCNRNANRDNSHLGDITTKYERARDIQSDNNMSLSATEPSHKPPISLQAKSPTKSGLELTALDGLVISAINHLSHKLRNNMIDVLESQRLENPTGSPARNLIDEVLPQMSANDRRYNENGVSVSRDLSAILKNLKKVEQSLEVVTSLLEPNASNSSKPYRKANNNFFVVDV